MKSLISRESHRPKKRYSGVYHVQGSMVTDADLDERSRITQDRTDNVGDDTVKNGVPVEGGAVLIDSDGTLKLKEGVIYADGIRGFLTATKQADIGSALSIFDNQTDFTHAPPIPSNRDQIIFADIWERPVYPLEDNYLTDVGLHGAVTSIRTRTMTQLKSAPINAIGEIENGTGRFPKIGTAHLFVKAFDATTTTNNCDPCDNEINLKQTVANALWRLEIIDVDGTPNNPKKITLAWSIENAAEIAFENVTDDEFKRPNKVYEFFSQTTESHLGVLADSKDAVRSVFVDDLSTMSTPAADSNNRPLPYVRRWDGKAEIDLIGSGDITSNIGSGYNISISNNIVTLNVGHFTIELHLKSKSVVTGDYWLVECRKNAADDEKVVAIQKRPFGVVHHYCTLFRIKNGNELLELTDSEVRKLSFPVLSNMPATHSAFDNKCNKLYDNADNIQEALDNLCDISAEDIAFTSECKELYNDSNNVQEALDSLCKIDFSVHSSFRMLFDWGVVCGLIPSLIKENKGNINITSGSFLDRSGRITTFKGDDLNLDKLEFGKEIIFKSKKELNLALRNNDACLALAAKDGGKVSAYIVPSAIAYGPDDPGFQEKVEECINKKDFIDVKDIADKFRKKRGSTVDRLLLASLGNNAFKGSAKLTEADVEVTEEFHSQLFTKFKKIALSNEVKTLEKRVKEAKKTNSITDTQGAAREVAQMQRASAILQVFLRINNERMKRCVCDALFPSCPPELGNAPYFVPIGCLKGKFDNDTFLLTDICAFSCRKQAMTMRSLQYFVGDGRDRVANILGKICCDDDSKEPGTTKPVPQFDPGKFKQLKTSDFIEKYNILEAFTGQQKKSNTDYKAKIKVNDLSQLDAEITLKGNGIDIVKTFDIDDPSSFDEISKISVGLSATDQLVSGESVKPGDKVGLLLQDGIARGYILLEKGSGKLPFTTAKSTSGTTSVISKEDELKAKLFIDNTNNAKGELTQLISLRETLSSDVGNLKSEIDILGRARDTATEEVNKVAVQLRKLAKSRKTITNDIKTVNTELALAEKNRKSILSTIRKAQPINAVIGNNASLIAKLAGEGITTVNDISKLSPTKITRLVRARIISNTDAAKFKEKALLFLK